MTSKNVEFKVGLLVIVGAAIVVFAIWLAEGYRYGQEYYSVSVVFPEVGALATGDPVAVSGVCVVHPEIPVPRAAEPSAVPKNDRRFMICLPIYS